MTATEAENAYAEIVEHLTRSSEVEEMRMMGGRSLKHKGKMFAGIRGDRLLVKLGKERVEALIADGRGTGFEPSGGRQRPMQDWVLVSGPVGDWETLAAEARDRA